MSFSRAVEEHHVTPGRSADRFPRGESSIFDWKKRTEVEEAGIQKERCTKTKKIKDL